MTPTRTAAMLIGAGATLSAVGLAIAGTVSPQAGGPLVLTGWLTLAAGIHRYGRSGASRADAPSTPP